MDFGCLVANRRSWCFSSRKVTTFLVVQLVCSNISNINLELCTKSLVINRQTLSEQNPMQPTFYLLFDHWFWDFLIGQSSFSCLHHFKVEQFCLVVLWKAPLFEWEIYFECALMMWWLNLNNVIHWLPADETLNIMTNKTSAEIQSKAAAVVL